MIKDFDIGLQDGHYVLFVQDEAGDWRDVLWMSKAERQKLLECVQQDIECDPPTSRLDDVTRLMLGEDIES